ncbi:response regulator [Rhodovulum sp. BSW8]|uniref:Response regulator n=3 Tax=Rhodovulum TaxID=34008 RepID=A0A4R8F8C5_9RHOB|nr:MULTISPECIES: response regulator [Rhodovulum]OLS44235.1 two-component system response regulator [Rhodovulum sulfidophilum]MBL3571005.1 response regulator [Rhodovulum visakhapatnamense]MBL3576670.1 response regulator [Rhodovulum visakhapatnamense]PTW49825.1 response regulator receiver protein [Rhodovulum kholense]RAP41370.1 two-component system response regulator [Rhodovulum viride]
MAKKVFIVDDSPSVRQMVKKTLAGAGYDVMEAGDGEEALSLLASVRPDAILTDQNMPRMDGLSFIRAYRGRPGGMGVPIVFLSTETRDDLRQQAKAAGALGWMSKPFDQAQLLTVVKRMVGT